MNSDSLDMPRSENTLEFGGKDFVGGEKVLEEEEEFGGKNDSEDVDDKMAEEIDAEAPIDRLSELPDSLLVHILSFLKSMRKAAITSVLSKRWRTLWADLPSLNFQDNSCYEDFEGRQKFSCFVSRALQIRSINYLETLDVTFNFSRGFAYDVDEWVDFAVKYKVKDLKLRVLSGYAYWLPQIMYSNSSLARLKLHRCIVAPWRAIEWPRLTRLHIGHVKVHQDVMEKILSCSRVLNTLWLDHCWGFDYLDVKCPNLCELKVQEIPFHGAGEMLEISAPYLRFLAITRHYKTRMLKIKNIPSLVGAFINIYGIECISEEVGIWMSYMRELFEDIGHVEELKLGVGTSMDLSKLVESTGWRFPASRLRRLQVKGLKGSGSNSVIAGLLESSPQLKELIIDGLHSFKIATDQAPVVKNDLDCDLLHLETVKIRSFAEPNREPLLTAARILLKRATMLKEMVIEQQIFEQSKDIDKMVQTLSGYPRSSQKAKLIFRYIQVPLFQKWKIVNS